MEEDHQLALATEGNSVHQLDADGGYPKDRLCAIYRGGGAGQPPAAPQGRRAPPSESALPHLHHQPASTRLGEIDYTLGRN